MIRKGGRSKRVSMTLKVAAFFLLFIFSPNVVRASSISFSQSILPTKIVYLDSTNEIKSIWSNVSVKDDVYIIKFFDLKKNAELDISGKLLDSFQQFETKKVSYNFDGERTSVTVYFVQKNNNLEEVLTLV